MVQSPGRPRARFASLALVTLLGVLALLPGAAIGAPATPATPIQHLVVIFQENITFDHYFATYPNAADPGGEPGFAAAPGTPKVNGLSGDLLTHNPNLANPQRLGPKQALTCDMNHEYTAEQKAADGGKLDRFVQETEGKPGKNTAQFCPTGIVMGYYDGNTVTGLWTYAQRFAMSDNAFGTTFGPSTTGALNLTAGDTAGAVCGPADAVYQAAACASAPASAAAGAPTGTVYSDADPYYDDCSKGGPADKSQTIAMSGPNVGDRLTAAGVTWGWFQGGFADCKATHVDQAYDAAAGIDPATDKSAIKDYNPHHEPFQYFASTANPRHLRPTSPAMIGRTDQANHQYDLTDFWAAVQGGVMPAVSFLKAPNYQDGHPGYSDPLDEQVFLADTLNRLQQTPEWASTAVVINYDDSDGWYDHVTGPLVNHSATALDAGCGATTDGAPARCGYGPRVPYLVISPYAKVNDVDHTVIDQTSTLRFIEDNWLSGKRMSATSFDNKAGPITGMFDFQHAQRGGALLLDPATGEVATGAGGTPAP